MTPYEIIILLVVFGAVVYLAARNIERLKAKLENEMEYRDKLEERIEKLEAADAQNVPGGYLFKDYVDNVNALTIRIQEIARVQNELLKQLRNGNVRLGQKKD